MGVRQLLVVLKNNFALVAAGFSLRRENLP
jgi:hypothetical protein